MSYTTTLHYVPKASWRSLSGSAQNRPVFESFRDDRLASVRVATGKGTAVEETVRKLVLTLPHARARSRPALTAGHGVTRGKFSHSAVNALGEQTRRAATGEWHGDGHLHATRAFDPAPLQPSLRLAPLVPRRPSRGHALSLAGNGVRCGPPNADR